MALHKKSWAVLPFIVLILCWAAAATSPKAANLLVETGFLTPQSSALFDLPGAHGAGLGVFNVLLYVGVMFVVGPIWSVATSLDYVWDSDFHDDNEAPVAEPTAPRVRKSADKDKKDQGSKFADLDE